MGFDDKPAPSVGMDKQEDGWLVTVHNLDNKARQEKFFYSRAEADAYMQSQYQRIREAE